MSAGQTLVMKFGGTSVGTPQAMRQAADIILEERKNGQRVIVVTSALSGVTDLLLTSAVHAARGDLSVCRRSSAEIVARHLACLEALITPESRRTEVHQEIRRLVEEFNNLCSAIAVLGETSPRALDAAVSFGERLSVRLLAAAVQSAGGDACAIESTRLIQTDDHYQNANPDMVVTAQLCHSVLDPLLEQGITPIVTGFIGAAPNGTITTLGRGGSDFSASIIAVVLKADDVWIWTDVDGVMTADPRLVPDAHTLPVISYREVAELAYYGAKVLHPKSIHPVIAAGIGLRVCNTFNPHNAGTRLTADKDSRGHGTIKAVTAIRGLKLVTLSGRGMLGVPGVAGRIFNAVATTGISVPLIIESTSEQSICFAAPRDSIPDVLLALKKNLRDEFARRDIDQAEASEDVDIITILSPGLRSVPGIAGQIFSTLGSAGINVLAISYGASDVSINLVVSAEDTKPALRALHTLVPASGGTSCSNASR